MFLSEMNHLVLFREPKPRNTRKNELFAVYCCTFIMVFNKYIGQPQDSNCVKDFWVVPCRTGPRGILLKSARTLNDCKNSCKQRKKCKGFNWHPRKV